MDRQPVEQEACDGADQEVRTTIIRLSYRGRLQAVAAHNILRTILASITTRILPTQTTNRPEVASLVALSICISQVSLVRTVCRNVAAAQTLSRIPATLSRPLLGHALSRGLGSFVTLHSLHPSAGSISSYSHAVKPKQTYPGEMGAQSATLEEDN